MSAPKASNAGIVVRLVCPGVGARDYHLAEGATLGDLLRCSGISTTYRTVLLDGVPLEEALTLHEGAVVTIDPRPTNTPANEPWRAAVPAFRDEALFQEYSEVLKMRRKEPGPADDGRDV
jgi:hypothetical protein